MKAYVYRSISDGITSSYHSGGGLLIITDRGPAKAWRDYVRAQPRPDDLTTSLPRPTLVIDTVSNEERVFVFPDEGCC